MDSRPLSPKWLVAEGVQFLGDSVDSRLVYLGSGQFIKSSFWGIVWTAGQWKLRSWAEFVMVFGG